MKYKKKNGMVFAQLNSEPRILSNSSESTNWIKPASQRWLINLLTFWSSSSFAPVLSRESEPVLPTLQSSTKCRRSIKPLRDTRFGSLSYGSRGHLKCHWLGHGLHLRHGHIKILLCFHHIIITITPY